MNRLAFLGLLAPASAWAQEPIWSEPEYEVSEALLESVEGEVEPDEIARDDDPSMDALPEPPEVHPVALPTGEAKSGVTPQALALPIDGGSVEGLGESFSPLLSSGTATFSVPIALPPGRRGTQPGLSFSYSSSGGNGSLGIGWGMAVPFISRQTDKGLPHYGGADRFMYNGGQELVEVAPASDTNGDGDGDDPEQIPFFVDDYRYFRARVEGAFLRFFLAPNESHWIVQDKDGTLFYLGETPDARVEHDDWGTYLWSLTRVSDVRGNEVRYAYRAKDDTRQVYLDQVVWNSPLALIDGPPQIDLFAENTAFQHAVTLTYEERDDDVDSYVSRFRVTTGQRLVQVDVESKLAAGEDRTLGRTYILSYDADSFLSLLSSIEVLGRDGTALPPMTFGYSEVDPHAPDGGELDDDLPGWGGFDGRVTELESSPDHSMDEGRTDLFDIDADAFPDVLVTDPARFDDGHGVFFLDFVEGVGTYTASDIIEVPGSIGGDLTLSNSNVNPMDLDADGRVELLHMPHVREWSAFTAEGSREDGFAWVEKGPYDPAHEDIDFTRDAAEIRLADIDNDHRIDVIRSSGTRMEFYRNRGDGTFEEPVTSCVLHRGMPLRFSNGDLFLSDMNGDGLQDLVHLRRGDVAYWPGRGYGLWGGDADLPGDCTAGEFGDEREELMDPSPFWSDLEDDRVRLADVNGDGLADLVQVRFDGVDLWLNEAGKAFTDRYIIERSPFDPGFTQRVRHCDVNASGSHDILWGDGERYKYMDLTGAIRPRLLTSVDNGLGKSTTLDYEADTVQQSRAADAGEPWATVAPFPVQVVSRMTVADNLGGEYVTEYEYRDALYDGLEAEFRGFGEAIVRTIGDANSPTSEQRTVFHQGVRPEGSDPDDNPYEALKGAVRLTETCDLEGVCLETSHTTWKVRRLHGGIGGDPRGVWYAFAAQTDTYRFDTAPFDPSDAEVELPSITSDVAPEAVDVVRRRGDSYAHLVTRSQMDDVGNQLTASALGVDDDATDDIVTGTDYDVRADWLWRPTFSRVLPSFQETTRAYNEFGEVLSQEVHLVNDAEDRQIIQVVNTYNDLGQVIDVKEASSDVFGADPLRHRSMSYDADFSAYVVAEQIYTDDIAFLQTFAAWDAGFGVITQLLDFNLQATEIEYDGLSRVSAIRRPGCDEDAVRYEYLLAGDTDEAFNEVVTRSNEECGDEADATLDSHAFVDGLGRARMTLSEADTFRGDEDDFVRSGFVTFDGKGAASRAYLPDFRGSASFSLALPTDGYTSTRYDAFGREARSVAPDRLAATETLYHALSRDVWDPNDLDPTSGHFGTPTSFGEDGQGRLLSVTERNIVDGATEEYVTSYTYSPLNNLLTIDRTFGATTVHRQLEYDSLGRRTVNTDPDAGEWTYEYSDANDLVRTVDARPRAVAYSYDLAGRLVAEDYDEDGVGGVDGGVEVTYTFDDPGVANGLGRLTSVRDLSGTTRFKYDSRGRETAMARILDADDGPRTESMTYDELDRESSMTYPDGSVATYTYTDRGLLYSASLGAQVAVASIEYNASGQRRLEVLGDLGSTENQYTYDRRLRLSSLTSVSDAGCDAPPCYYQDWQYEFDRASNITAIRDLRTPDETAGWSPSPADQDYSYDALYRLVRNRSVYAEDQPLRPHDQTWSYDYLGNMTDWRDLDGNGDAHFFDRSLGAIENGVDTDPAVRPDALVRADLDALNFLTTEYNASGDMEMLDVTKSGVIQEHRYTWDAVHRLATAEVDGVPSSFAYDYADQRRVKDEDGAVTLYVSESFELRGGVSTKWLRVGTQRLLRVSTEDDLDDVSFYLTNHLGTTSVVIDEAGDPRSASTTLPYGTVESEVLADPGFRAFYRFTGKERDEKTGLDYFGARYYASALGRWLGPDPLMREAPHKDAFGGTTRGNHYAYGVASPIRIVDPSGMEGVVSEEAMRMFQLLDSDQQAAIRNLPIERWEGGIRGAFHHTAATTGRVEGGHAREVGEGFEDLYDYSTAILGFAEFGFNVAGRWVGKRLLRIALREVAEDAGQAYNVAGRRSSATGAWRAVRAWTSNQLGAHGEGRLARLLGGAGGRVSRRTGINDAVRVIDRLVGQHAHEAKTGYTTLGRFEQAEIAKDAWLKAQGVVTDVTWHFFRSPQTGEVGPSRPLWERLVREGFNVVIHEAPEAPPNVTR